MMTAAMGTIDGCNCGCTSTRPSMADRIEMAGVKTPSPSRQPAARKLINSITGSMRTNSQHATRSSHGVCALNTALDSFSFGLDALTNEDDGVLKSMC